MNDYEKHARKIAKKIGLKMMVIGKGTKEHFNDNVIRDVYTIKLYKDDNEYIFEFGQSLNNSDHLELSYASLPFNTHDKQWRKYGEFGAKFYNYEDDVKRDIEKIMSKTNVSTFKRDKHIKDNFRIDSITGTKPTYYDVLTCVQKYEVGTFEDFCGNFGYDEDSRQAEKTYHAVYEEYEEMSMLCNTNELELLQEIE